MKARSSLSAGMLLGISLLQLNCGSHQGGLAAAGAGAGPLGAGASDAGSGAAPGTGGATASGGAVTSGAGTDPGVGGVSLGGAPSSALPGVCPDGFIACSGVCLESSLIGKDCRPLSCDAIDGNMPLARTNLTARGYEWNVDLAGDTTTVTFKPGAAGGGLEATIAADITYRVNGDPALHTATMTDSGAGTFTFDTHDLKAGDDLEFFFHTTVAPQKIILPGPGGKPLIDTMWFHQVVGMPHSGEPSYPLTVKLAGRFRDRHPNEERYDHYVDTYFAGPTFDLTFIDHGDALDVTIKPQAMMDVQAVDFKNYECFGSGQYGALPEPAPLCGTPPALAAVGVRAKAMGDGTFTTRVEHLAYGQLVDFELTFVRSRTYYTEWFSYYVGSGRFQPKAQHPWASAAGEQSVSNVTLDEFGYAQHVPNITPEELANFISGKVLFEADFDTHVGYNPPTTFDCPRGLMPGANVPTIVTPPPPSPLFTAGNSYSNMTLGSIPRPGYTSASCFNCHHLDGKGHPPDDKGMGDALVKLFTDDGSPDATYGTILDSHAAGGGAPEAQPKVTWQTMAGTFADGTPYELRKPVLAVDGLRDGALGATTHASLRIPRPVFGLGLIEAVAPETILARADADDANKDGISGRPNFVKDPVTGQQVLGRFGWKAATASLREQAALAFVNDIGITSPLFPQHRCGENQPTCKASVASATAPQLTDTDLDHIQSYLRGLSVPPRRNYEDPKAIAGKDLFASMGCINCHVPNLVTSTKAELPELRGIDIQPFTDLLLHDMGSDLADDAPVEEGVAKGNEWRTPPLWGNGTGAAVMFQAIDAFDPNGHPPPGGVYLHDGRARSITEAILWHGGEAAPMRLKFLNLPAEQREQLLAYVAYPFADPLPARRCDTAP